MDILESAVRGSEHVALFYETDAFLLASLHEFIATGLMAGDAAIVVATGAHQAALDERLRRAGLDVAAAYASGQYVALDAAATLARFMAGGMPDPERFARIIEPLFTGAGGRPVRVFGEMVAILWTRRQYDAAIRLEGLWNALRARHPFSLFCAYPITGTDGDSHAAPLGDICAEHSRIIPAESYPMLSGPEDRLRAIVELQQQAHALQAQIAERREAQKRLQGSELRYRRLFETSTDGILIVDATTLQIIDANPVAAELLGLAREELRGSELREIGLLTDGADAREALRELRGGQAMRYEHLPLHTRDGQRRDVELVGNVYEADGQQIFQCNLRDITKRRQAEETVRSLLRISESLTSTLDLQTLMDILVMEAVGLVRAESGVAGLHEPQGMVSHAYLQRGQWLPLEYCWPPGHGLPGWLIGHKVPYLTNDALSDPQIVHQLCVQFGVRQALSTPVLSGCGEVLGFFEVHNKLDGGAFTQGDLEHLIAVSRIASIAIQNALAYQEIQKAERERRELLAREQAARVRAEEASRLKDEFLATVSHELRTPLTTILGWAQRLRRGRRDEATVARALEVIERNAKAQAQLVEDILDVSRMITGKLRLSVGPVDLATVINAAIDAVQLAAEAKGIYLDVTLDPSARHILGDAGRLQQVVWNLLSNAIKFTPHGGAVHVRLERAGQEVQIAVSDTGEGIRPDFLPFVFDRFRQGDGTSTRRHFGLGLGLAIVRHLVELHGGTVHAASPGEGHGATFTVRFPLAATHEHAQGQQIDAPPNWMDGAARALRDPLPQLEGLRVLLVDDDQDTLHMLSLLLTEHRATVQTAASSAEALAILRWYRPDVLVSDLAMPDADGYALIGTLRVYETEDGPQIPAVALTAYARVEDRMRALSAGFNMFVPKPVEPDELIAVIAGLIRPAV
ncbi:MAG TPA: ATP-binding protein [Roseiflexaceae bacterium]|nr:ATP-binding protein [Roseiflexaceae bacterium]